MREQTSRILRFRSRLGDRIRFFTSCWEIVEPPCSIWPDVRFFSAAPATDGRSTPSFVQNVLSSVATTALMTTWGTWSRVTFWRFSSPRTPISLLAES